MDCLCPFFFRSRCIASAFAGSFTTFDGESYTYDCPGEYSLVELQQTLGSGQFRFSAHVLIDATYSSTNLSVPETSITAIALSNTHSSSVQVEVNASSSLRILVDGTDLTDLVQFVYADDGENITFACLSYGTGCHRVVDGVLVTTRPRYGVYVKTNLSIILINRTACKVVFSSGITIDITLTLSTGSLSLDVALPAHFRAGQSLTQVTGLLGNFDGNGSDDFYFPGNSSLPARFLPAPLSLYDAFFLYCKQCELT